MDKKWSASKVRNITISGKVACGTTTLFHKLKAVLEPKGWKFFSGGEFMRQYAIKNNLFPKDSKNHHAATIYPDEFDKEVDAMMRKRLQEESKLLIESDLAGFNASGIDGVFKILLDCSDDAVRIDRLVNRDKISVAQAKEHLIKREAENVNKWKRLYGDHDFWNPKYYDLVIDTYKNGPTETLNLALKAIEVY